MRQEPTLRQLRYFLAVAKHANFREAATRLGISQPTLSAQIAALEASLEASLFERSRAGTILTPTARSLLSDARDIVERFDSFTAHAKGHTWGVDGTHRFGVPPTLGPYFLPDIIGDLHRDYPRMRLYVRENPPRKLQEELLDGDHDLILTSHPLLSGDFQHVDLFHEPLVLAVSTDHPFAERASVKMRHLKGAQLLSLGERYHLSTQVQLLADKLGASLLRDYEGTSLDTLRQMVATGIGISFLPALYVRSEISGRQDVATVPVSDLVESRTITLAWRNSAPHAALYRDLANKIRSIIAERLLEHVTLADLKSRKR